MRSTLKSIETCSILLGGVALVGIANAGPCTDDYNRYEVKVPLNKTVDVTTAYGSGSVTLDYARRLVAPVSPAPLDGPHRVAYEAEDNPHLAGPVNVLVDTALTDFVVSGTKGLAWIEVPAVKDAEPPLSIPTPPGDQPAYACYRLKVAGPNLAKSTQHTTDQFGHQTFAVQQPESLCVPATFNGSTPAVAPAHACFTVRPAKPILDPPMVAVSTAFQSFLFDVDPLDEYCVEATLSDVP